MDSMNDNDRTLPIDFNGSTQVPRVMDTDVTLNATVNETANVHTMKDHEMHISELKKENFELKLRIYFLEEKLQHSQRDTDEDAFKMNIELKVEIEKLKSELTEKRRLLVKASAAVDSLDRNNQEQIKKLRDQHNVDIEQIKHSYELKMREYEGKMKEMELRTKEHNELLYDERRQLDNLQDKLSEAERINRKLKDDMSKPGFSSLESTEIQAKFQASLREKDRIIEELKAAVDVRGLHIKQSGDSSDMAIKKQIKELTQKTEERDTLIQELKDKLKKAEVTVKNLRGEVYDKEKRLQLTTEAHTTAVQKHNEKLNQKQIELDEVQEKFRVLQQNLEKAQDIIDEASLKDVEAFEEKSKALKAKDALIAELQGNLKEREMENDNLSRTIERKDVELQKLLDANTTPKKTQQQIQEKEDELMALTDQLALVKNKLREANDKHEEERQKKNLDHQHELSAKDQIIRRVTETLDEKENIIQDLIVTQQHISLSSSLDGITDSKEELIQKLRDRLKERDEAVEANIEDKFQSLRQKEEELQELRKGLRERDRLIENINATVIQHEDTLNNHQSSIAEKDNLINDLKINLQNKQTQFEEANKVALKRCGENEGLIEKLKRNLVNREQQIENLKTVLQRNASKEAKDVEETELVNELSNTLKEKEKMLSDMLTERSQMIANTQENEEKMMSTLLEKDQLLKEMAEKLEKACVEKNAIISRLQQQINSLNLDIQSLENNKAWTTEEHEILLGKVRQSLSEKERTIEKLIKSGKEKDKVFLKLQECTSNKTTSPVRLEVANLKNTIQDLNSQLREKQDVIEQLEKVKRENEAQKTDRSSIANLEYTAELELELEHRDSLLTQAADSIEAFKAKLNNLPVLEELKKKLAETEEAFSKSEGQRNKLEGDMKSVLENHNSKVQSLEKEISLLKQEKEALSLQVKKSDAQPQDQGRDVKQLRDLLQEQVDETAQIRNILHKEHEAYKNMVKQSKLDHKTDDSSKVNEDLQLISRLRQSLDNGIVENNKLRAELHRKIAAASEQRVESSQEEEMKRLQAKLEDSERWNTSLQSRLDALQPRARGVGGSEGNLSTLGRTSPVTRSPVNDEETPTKTMKRMEELKSRLDESQKMNARLQKQLENMARKSSEKDLSTLGSTPPSSRSQANNEETLQMEELKSRLDESQRVNSRLQKQLENMARSPERDVSTPRTQASNEEAVTKAMKQAEELKLRLDESQKTNARLQKQLENMSRKRPEELSGQNRLNEQQKHEINLLREELKKSQNLCNELRTTGKKMEAEMASYKKEQQNEFNSLKKAFEDSQRFTVALQEQLAKQKDDKENQTSFELGIHPEPDGALDSMSRNSPLGIGQDSQVQRELEEMYRKNEELRRTLSGTTQLDRVNQKLKQDLLTSRQQNTLLGQRLEETLTKLEEMTSEVTRLEKELDSAHALNIDFASQLKRLRDQVQETGNVREGLITAKNMIEKLKDEKQHLLTSVEKVGKENERLEELSVNSRSKPDVASASSQSADNARSLDTTDASSSLAPELQSLRKKLEMSEKLNAALKYELEVTQKNAGKSGASGEPLLGHVEELRQLRSRLEESIRTYDALCVQLEEKLSELNGEGDSETKDRVILVKENEELRSQLGQFTEKMKKVQNVLEEQKISGKRDKEQLSLIQNQLVESNKVNESLRKELALYDRVLKLDQPQSNGPNAPGGAQGGGSTNNDAIILLMNEIRSLRKQLEASIESNNSLRQMLQNQLSLPQRHVAGATSTLPGGLVTRTSPVSFGKTAADRSPKRASSSPVASKVSSQSGVNVAFESETLEELRQHVNSSFHNSESLLIKMTRLTLEGQDKDGHLDDLKKEVEKLRSLLFKSNMLLDHLWAQQLSSGPTAADRLTKQNEELQKEITALKKRVLSQSKILENTATRLESSSRMRKEVERSLFARLTETRQTLGSARQNLQDRLSSQNSDLN